MKNYMMPLLTGAALTLAACSNDEADAVMAQPEAEAGRTGVVFTANDFVPADAPSRTAITPGTDGASFAWVQTTDTIGILPDDGAQVYFAISELDAGDASSATFTGGAWGLKAENEYAAYYPFIQDIMLKRTAVPVDYSVQTYKHQTTAEGDVVVSPSHDYMAARSTTAESGGLAFNFSHLGALVEVQFTLPEAAAVNSFYLTADEAIFPVKGTFDLTAETVAITPDENNLAYSVVVNVEGLATTEADQTVSVFFMMPPFSVNTNTLTATVMYGDDNTALPLQITTEKTALAAGTYYTLQTEAMSVSETSSPYIAGNWGTELSNKMKQLGCTKLRFVTGSTFVSADELCTPTYSQPGAYGAKNGAWLEVHTLGKEFALSGNNVTLGMFQENNFMTEIDLTGINTAEVTSMSNMFYGCSSLETITFGSGFNTAKVESMASMFYDCSSLTSLDLSNFNTAAVTDMNYLFRGCSSLTSLDLSNFSTAAVTNMYGMFLGCSSLTSLDLSSFNTAAVTNMAQMFQDCSSLTSLNLSSFTFKETGCDYYLMFYQAGYNSYASNNNTPVAVIYVSEDGKAVLETMTDTTYLEYATLEVKETATE